jgi:predicted ATP-dependent endonuclease of OLD family
MIQIEHVEIKYFRSIYRVRLPKLTDVIILAGRNDVGKSNILKALNLFFNNQTDWNVPFEFNRDFSQRRLSEVRKETIKGKQYIQVVVGFIRGARSEKSLPEKFTVTKTWYRDSLHPEQKSSLQSQFGHKCHRS